MNSAAQLQTLFEDFLTKNPFINRPKNLYEPCNYILSLGGKRIRPTLVLMGYEIFDHRIERALPAAMSVEIFHNFSLIHDDIMDAAPLRRGRPTVHERWNQTTGILSGDVMLIAAYAWLEKIRDRKSAWNCTQILSRVAREVCEGQQSDMDFEQKKTVSMPEYLKMIERKTSVLLGGALEMGATIAKAPKNDIKNLYEVGRLAGIAFQIQDDLLDSFGDPAKFGKQVGGDILQNKKTFLVIELLRTAPESAKNKLKKCMQMPPTSEKIEAVKSLFRENGVIEMTEKKKKQFSDAAFEKLEKISVEKNKKIVLEKTLTDLLNRDF